MYSVPLPSQTTENTEWSDQSYHWAPSVIQMLAHNCIGTIRYLLGGTDVDWQRRSSVKGIPVLRTHGSGGLVLPTEIVSRKTLARRPWKRTSKVQPCIHLVLFESISRRLVP